MTCSQAAKLIAEGIFTGTCAGFAVYAIWNTYRKRPSPTPTWLCDDDQLNIDRAADNKPPTRLDYWKENVVRHRLGEGGFSIAYLIRDASGSEKVLKQYKRTNGSATDEVAAFCALKESGLAERCGLPVIRDVALVPRRHGSRLQLSIELDYRGGRDLHKITLYRGFSNEQSLVIARDLLQSLAPLHAAGLAYRDIKLANVIWDGERAYLIDCGNVCRTPSATAALKAIVDCQKYNVTTPHYGAPELYSTSSTSSTSSSDIWALGVLLWETMTSELSKIDTEQACFNLSDKAQRLAETSQGDFLYNIVASMLRTDPSARPSAQELLNQLNDHSVGTVPATKQ